MNALSEDTFQALGQAVRGATERIRFQPLLLVWAIGFAVLLAAPPDFRIIENIMLHIASPMERGVEIDLVVSVARSVAVAGAYGVVFAGLYSMLEDTTPEDTLKQQLAATVSGVLQRGARFLGVALLIGLLIVGGRVAATIGLLTGVLAFDTIASLVTELLAGQPIPWDEGLVVALLVVLRGAGLAVIVPFILLYPVLTVDDSIETRFYEIPGIATYYGFDNFTMLSVGSIVFFFPEVLLQGVRFLMNTPGNSTWMIVLAATGLLKVLTSVFLYEWYTDTLATDVQRVVSARPRVFATDVWRPAAKVLLVFLVVTTVVGGVRVADPDFNHQNSTEPEEFGVDSTVTDAFDNRDSYSTLNRGVAGYHQQHYEAKNTFENDDDGVDNADHYTNSDMYGEFIDDRNEAYLRVSEAHKSMGETPQTGAPTQPSMLYFGSDGLYSQTGSLTTGSWTPPYGGMTMNLNDARIYDSQLVVPGLYMNSPSGFDGRAYTASKWERTGENNTHVVFRTTDVNVSDPRFATDTPDQVQGDSAWDALKDSAQLSESATGVVVVDKTRGIPVSAEYTYTAQYEMVFYEDTPEQGQPRNVTRDVTVHKELRVDYSYGNDVPIPEKTHTVRGLLLDAIAFSD